MPPYDFLFFFFSSREPLEKEMFVVSFAVAELKGDINSLKSVVPFLPASVGARTVYQR